ncbi:MAG: hypothetical protein IPQ19_10170 [Bacteroidetes bacterium]|nr:hypothetical protein [Bacteroidota bacterium]
MAESASKGNYSWDGFPFLDLYFVPIASRRILWKSRIDERKYYSKLHESSATFYGDTKMYFTRNSMVNNKGLKVAMIKLNYLFILPFYQVMNGSISPLLNSTIKTIQ